MPDKEKEEVREIFAGMGMSEATQTQVVEEMSKDKEKWVDFMMRYELGLEKPELNRARNSAMTIAAAYVAGGFIPLGSYFFTDTPQTGLYYSVAVTIIALALFGFFKNRAIGQDPWRGALKVTLIGILAAGSAFLIAKLVSGH